MCKSRYNSKIITQQASDIIQQSQVRVKSNSYRSPKWSSNNKKVKNENEDLALDSSKHSKQRQVIHYINESISGDHSQKDESIDSPMHAIEKHATNEMCFENPKNPNGASVTSEASKKIRKNLS